MADINQIYEEAYIGESDDEEFIGESGDDEDDEADVDDGDRNGKSKDKNGIILQGLIHMNDEGRYVYSGTWDMQQDTSVEKPGKSGLDGDKDKDDNSTSSNNNDNSKNKKKKKKFKLKSKEQLKDESTKTTINLLTIENGDSATNETIDKPQSILFDGFFVTDETDKIQPHRKVKERDVEMTFSRISDPPTRGSSNRDSDKLSTRRYRVEGKGANEFGSFSIEGSYTLHQENGSDKKEGVSLTCRKWYTPVVKPKKRRWGDAEGNGSEEEDDDDEISGDEATDFEEVIGLQDEAGMSIEELRKRYYGGGDDDNDSTVCKKSKLMDDDNDDGCGF